MIVILIITNHLRQAQFIYVFLADRQADQALGIGEHKVDIFGCAELGSADKVAFVFPFGIVCNDDNLASLQCLDSFFDGIVLLFVCIHVQNLLHI